MPESLFGDSSSGGMMLPLQKTPAIFAFELPTITRKIPGGPSLEAQKPARANPHGDSRDLVAQGVAAIAHLRLLRELLDSLEQRLNSSS